MGTKGPQGMEKAELRIEMLKRTMEKKNETCERLKNAGVFFIDAESCIISEDTEIGENTVVYPNVIFEGKVKIGKGCIIWPGTRITDSTLGDFCEIQNSVITSSTVGNSVTMGPFAYIRPESEIGDRVKIGDFVEIKKTILGEGTKVSHLTYLGDATIGKNVNFGCGTVVVNYDGKVKNRTEVGDNSFIGCNTNLVAPVKIGCNAYTAAGTTVTQDVPDGNLAVGRARQENKEGWVEKKGFMK